MRRHAALLGLALLIVWPLLHFDGAFTVDEGSYAVQARTLADGTWDMGYAFQDADPEGRFEPYHGAAVTDEGEIVPYAKHPLVPELMRVPAELFGEQLGFRLFGVLSVLVLACCAWAIAAELGTPRAGPWAFWIAAVSPVLANAWILWPHAPSSALSALVVLGALRAARSWCWAATASAAGAIGVLVRSEGLLLAAAVGAAVLLVGTSRRHRVAGVAIGVAGGAAFLVERAWREAIIGGASTLGLDDRGAGSGLVDHLGGLRVAVIDGAVADDAAKVLVLVALALVVVVALRLRDAPPEDPGPGLLIGAAAALLALRFLLVPDDPALGLLAAAPVLALGLAWRPSSRDARWLIGALALFVGAVTATTYSDGGAFQWGGRFLSPLLAPLAAVAAIALVDRLGAEDERPAPSRVLALGVVALLVVQGAGALAGPERTRDDTRQQLASVTRLGEEVIVAKGQMIPRLDWRAWPQRCWISIPADGDAADAKAVLDVLARSGVGEAAYAGVRPSLLRAAGAEVRPSADNDLVGTVTVPDPAPTWRLTGPYSCGPGR